MKKLIAFLLCGGLLFVGKGLANNNFELFENATKVVVVCEKQIEGMDNEFLSGKDYYYTFEGDEVKKCVDILSGEEGIKGINLYFDKEIPLSYFQRQLDFLGEESCIGENTIYYGYYSYYKHFKWIDGKKTNVQLVYSQDGWILGMPLILTGF